MKNLSKFSNQQLASNEMKAIKGGGGGYCACQCTNGPGSWTGYYSNQASAASAVNNYCGGVGGCQCVFA